MTFQPIVRGPQKGAPPSLEFVGIDRLQVDTAYQRATDGPHSRRIIVGMVKEWNWALCQPLVVARRTDGSLWILDGQHRHAGATERGDIVHLPCVVLPAIGADEEARAFVDLNTKRQRLSQTDIFHGMLAAGDLEAKATAELLEATGWRVVRGRYSASWKPGDLDCAPSVATQLRIHGPVAVREALWALRSAYPDEVVAAPARLLQALVQIFRPESPNKGERARLVASMKPISARAWMPRADKYRLHYPDASQVQSIVAVIAQAAGLWKEPLAPRELGKSAPRAQTVAARVANEKLFSDDGRAWCSQCEQRVDRSRAAACTSQFCKLKS
jgi:hypothetical protein